MTKEYTVQWTIELDANSPEEAAKIVWSEIFNQPNPTPDDPCVFEVYESNDQKNTKQQINLSTHFENK